MRECSRRWTATNPEKNRAKRHNYRARTFAAPGSHTAADIAAQFARQRGRCFWCGERLGARHTDHVIPLAKGGSDGPENIVIACPTCNHSKGAKHPMEFAGRLC